MLDNDFLEKIKRIKRSPKLGDIYEIYRKEQLIAVKENTMLRQNRVYEKYLSVIANTRVDRFQPLIICKQILNPVYQENKYTTCLYIARLLVKLLDFSVACNLIKENPLKELFSLPLLKKAQKMQSSLESHHNTLPYENLKSELEKIITKFKKKASLRRQLLLEISLRTILRQKEVTHLKITDLNDIKHELTVRQTKTLEVFVIPTTESLEKTIKKAYQEYGSKTEKWIFSGLRDNKKPISTQTLNKALKDLGYKGYLCAHGIRSVASNFFAKNSDKIHPWTAEAMLQHSVGTAVARAYRRDNYLNERKKAAKLWNEWLDSIYNKVNGNSL